MRVLHLVFMLFTFAYIAATTHACVYTTATTDINLHQLKLDNNEFENVMWTLNHYENEWKADAIGDHIYLKPESLYFANNKIYLTVDQISIPLESIHCDQKGYYLCLDFWGLGWRCCTCYKGNGPTYKTCQYCYKIRCGFD